MLLEPRPNLTTKTNHRTEPQNPYAKPNGFESTRFLDTQLLVNECLNQQDLIGEVVRIEQCERGGLDSRGYCGSRFCLSCEHYKALRQRKHLLRQLPAVLKENPAAQVWHVTACAQDCHSEQLREYARAVITGTRRLLKHDDLKNRVIASFSTLEVGFDPNREHPSRAHTHTLLVTKQITSGRYHMAASRWLTLWEQSCTLHRARLDASKPLSQRLTKGEKANPSILVQRVQTPLDRKKVIRYVTWTATSTNTVRDFKQRMVYPITFIRNVHQLRNVTRYQGSMRHRPGSSVGQGQGQVQGQGQGRGVSIPASLDNLRPPIL